MIYFHIITTVLLANSSNERERALLENKLKYIKQLDKC